MVRYWNYRILSSRSRMPRKGAKVAVHEPVIRRRSLDNPYLIRNVLRSYASWYTFVSEYGSARSKHANTYKHTKSTALIAGDAQWLQYLAGNDRRDLSTRTKLERAQETQKLPFLVAQKERKVSFPTRLKSGNLTYLRGFTTFAVHRRRRTQVSLYILPSWLPLASPKRGTDWWSKIAGKVV